jgi:hypothetical protein
LAYAGGGEHRLPQGSHFFGAPVQLLLAQSRLLRQGSPFLSLHVPAPLQILVPLQTGALSVMPSGMFVQTPMVAARLHDLHVVVHALLQQTPSAQKELSQSAFTAHVSPSHFLQCVPPQSKPVSSPFCMSSLQEMHWL